MKELRTIKRLALLILALLIVLLIGPHPIAAQDNAPPTVTYIESPDYAVRAGNLAKVAGGFTDPDGGDFQTYTYLWEWGDGTSSLGTYNSTVNKVLGEHIYQVEGLFTVKLIVHDPVGNQGELSYEYIVVFNRDNYTAGRGYVNSPSGSYKENGCVSDAGLAFFSFISQYLKGKQNPQGETKFVFEVQSDLCGPMQFYSTVYDWLVVTGKHQAKYKGTGTINGEGNYGFMLTAFDADVNGNDDHEVDKLRMKIWDKNNGDVVVYDNQWGGSDDADATNEVVDKSNNQSWIDVKSKD